MKLCSPQPESREIVRNITIRPEVVIQSEYCYVKLKSSFERKVGLLRLFGIVPIVPKQPPIWFMRMVYNNKNVYFITVVNGV